MHVSGVHWQLEREVNELKVRKIDFEREAREKKKKFQEQADALRAPQAADRIVLLLM